MYPELSSLSNYQQLKLPMEFNLMDYIYYLQQMLNSSDDWVLGPYPIKDSMCYMTLHDKDGMDIICIYGI